MQCRAFPIDGFFPRKFLTLNPLNQCKLLSVLCIYSQILLLVQKSPLKVKVQHSGTGSVSAETSFLPFSRAENLVDNFLASASTVTIMLFSSIALLCHPRASFHLVQSNLPFILLDSGARFNFVRCLIVGRP